MRRVRTPLLSVVLALVLGTGLLSVLFPASPCLADTEGVLRLKVKDCQSSKWLVDARVDVLIYRPTVGYMDSDTGYTNGAGYVEFSFSDPEEADEARVTVTPKGQSPESGHVYYWTAPPGDGAGYWDVGIQGDSPCSDGWYDEGLRIIECVYN